MKIRTGFVSNSSSSSFIILDGSQTTVTVAIDMIKAFLLEAKDMGYSTAKQTKKCKSIIKFLKANKQTDHPLLFPLSHNYETWIYRQGKEGRVAVSTCRNNNWGDYMTLGTDCHGEGVDGEDSKILEELDFYNLVDDNFTNYNTYFDEKYPNDQKY